MVVPGASLSFVKSEEIALAGIKPMQRIKTRTNLVRRMYTRGWPVRNAVIIDKFNRIANLYINNIRCSNSVS